MQDDAGLVEEFNALIAEFDEGHQRFMHYFRAGRLAEARAVNAWMKVSLERQRAVHAELAALSADPKQG